MSPPKPPEDDFFIGWARPPRVDRRFLLGASLSLVAGAGGLGVGLSRSQTPPGRGAWDPADVRTFSGFLVREPFPALLTTDIDGQLRTAWLAGSGKDGVARRLDARTASDPADGVQVRGTLIRNGDHVMIAAVDGPDWIAPGSAVLLPPATTEDLGPARRIGEILDAKCWFGAMRPGAGKTHKSCAALCARGGLPTAFWQGGASCGGPAEDAPLLVDQDGRAHGLALLPLVGDPVLASGRLVRVREIIQFRVALGDFQRI